MAKGERRTLTRATWNAIAATCNRRYPSARRDKATILLMYRLGLRVGEVSHLRTKDVDLQRMTVRTPREGKTGVRVVGIPDSHELVTALRDWLDVRDRVDKSGKSPYLFCTTSGERVLESHTRRMLKRRAEIAGVESRVHPHMARHSFASEQIVRTDRDVNMMDVQEMLGHKNLYTTMVYLHGMEGRAVALMQSDGDG